MSGICGYVTYKAGQVVPPGAIQRMARAMTPAPDDPVVTMEFLDGAFGAYRRATSFAGAAEARISNGKVYAVWDGEFLNPEILAEANKDGDRRRIVSFLVDLYARFGTRMFEHLFGDFAVAIWDPREKLLIAACDRFRVKPLYYYCDDRCMFLASKLRAFSSCPGFHRSINLDAVVAYLDLSVVPTPDTIYRNVKKLPPGHVLVWKNNSHETVRYWDLRYREDPSNTEREYAERIREALKSSVEERLALADNGNEVGAFLSGGVDSTTVVGLLHRSLGSRVKAYSIGFSEDRFNEMHYARVAARHFGVGHREYFVSPSDTLDLLPRMSAEYDEPFGNSSAVPTYYCVKLARESGVSSMFAGDGGDELFAGNERYAHDKKFQAYQWIPSWIRKGFVDLLAPPLSRSGIPLLVSAGKYVSRANIPCPGRWFSYAPSRTIPICGEMLTEDLREAAGSRLALVPYEGVYREAVASSETNRFMYLDLKSAIADNDLFKVTRMSELAGLGVQFPFLCHRLAELSGLIPMHMKMKGFRLRSFFKRAFSDFLPMETVAKKKQGFGLPITVWLRTDPGLKELARELVLSPRSVQRGYFRKGFLEGIFACHATDNTSFYGSIIWNLMMLELWHRNHWDA